MRDNRKLIIIAKEIYDKKFQDAKVIKLAEKILAPHGGFYFEGYKLNAPLSWRKQVKNEKS